MTFIKNLINSKIQIKKLSIFKAILNILFLMVLVLSISFFSIFLVYKLNIDSYLITSIIIIISIILSIFILILCNQEKEYISTNSSVKKIDSTIVKYAFMLGIGIFLLNSSLLDPFLPKVPTSNEQAIDNALNEGILFFTLIITTIAPIFEEILMRGFFLNGFLKQYSPIFAIIISSIIFGIFHGNIPQFITATIIGCLLGLVYYHTNSLIICMIIHVANNASIFLIFLPNILLPSIICSIVFVIVGYILFRKGFLGLKLNEAIKCMTIKKVL
ncbi:MAG: lysostaphin resistance A-like protein [Sarcina sp.]